LLKFVGDGTGIDRNPRTRVSAIGGLVGGQKECEDFDVAWTYAVGREALTFMTSIRDDSAIDALRLPIARPLRNLTSRVSAPFSRMMGADV
jgi:hypothetical protein